jgi:type IX secretion system substrate protein/fibronectin type III domain protein
MKTFLRVFKINRLTLILSILLLSKIAQGQTTVLSEGFEENGTFPPSASWNNLNPGTPANPWQISTTAPNFGTYSAYCNTSSGNASNAWLITPGITLLSNTTYTITYYLRTGSGTKNEKFQSTIGTSNTVAAQSTLLSGTYSSTSYTQYTATYTTTASGGGTYYFGFNCYSAKTQSGIYIDDIKIVSAPANDLCSGAVAIPASGPFPYLTTAVNIATATNTGDPTPSCQATSYHGIWYTFTPATSGTYTFSTCSSATATTVTDDILSMYTGTCSSLTPLACNDDAGSTLCNGNSTQAIITAQFLNAGTTYYILASDYSSSSAGNIQIQVSFINAACSTPTALSSSGFSLPASSLTSSSIGGSFAAPSPAVSGYLVLYNTDGSTPVPVPGTTYTAGNTIGTSTVVQAGTATTFTATGLTPNTIYYIYVFSYNSGSTCGGPIYSATSVSGTEKTLNANYWWGAGSYYYLVNGSGSGTAPFSTNGNWSLGHPPTSSEEAIFTIIDFYNLTTIPACSIGSSQTIGALTVNYTSYRSTSNGYSNVFRMSINTSGVSLTVNGPTNCTNTLFNGSANGQLQFLTDNTNAAFVFKGNAAFGTSGGGSVFLFGNLTSSSYTGTKFEFDGNLTMGTTGYTSGANFPVSYVFDGATGSTQTVSINNNSVGLSNVVIGNSNSPYVLMTGPNSAYLNATATSANLTINNNATLDLGTYTLNRSASGGTLAINNTGILRLGGNSGGQGTSNFPTNLAVTTPFAVGSTVEYYGAAAQTIYASPTYGNLTSTNTYGTAAPYGATANAALTIKGNVLINSGAYLSSSSSTALTHTVGGNWVNNGGVFAPGSSTVNFNGGKAQFINGGTSSVTSQTFNNIATSVASTALSVSGFTNSLTLNGSLNIGNGTSTATTFDAGTATNIYVAGNWSDYGTTYTTGNFIPESGTVTFNGNTGPSAQSISATNAASETFNNLATATTATSGTGTILSMLNGSGYNLTGLTMNGSLSIAQFTKIAPPTGFGGMVVKGDWINNGTYTAVNGETVSFAGSVLQNIKGTSSTTFKTLGISNASAHVLLGVSTTASTLNFGASNSYIDVSAFTLTLSSPSITGSTPSTNNFVITGTVASGNLTVNSIGTSGFTLPIGVDSIYSSADHYYYLPVTIKPSNATFNWSAKVFPHVTATGAYPSNASGSYNIYTGTALNGIVNAVWSIASSGTNQPAVVTLQWQNVANIAANTNSTSFSNYTDNYIGISRNGGISWQAATASSANNNHPVSGYTSAPVTYTAISSTTPTASVLTFSTSFVPLGIGAIGDPLGLELINFNAELNNNKTVGLSWTTTAEINSSHFEVERSADGINWVKIGTVTAKGNSSSASNYEYVDANPLATNYYRIRMVNLNGDYRYTTMRVIKLLQLKGIVIFPNPARNYVNVSVSESAVDLNVKLISPLGQVLQVLQVKAGTGTTLTLDVHNYAQGTYLLQVSGSDGTQQTSKVMIMR